MDAQHLTQLIPALLSSNSSEDADGNGVSLPKEALLELPGLGALNDQLQRLDAVQGPEALSPELAARLYALCCELPSAAWNSLPPVLSDSSSTRVCVPRNANSLSSTSENRAHFSMKLSPNFMNHCTPKVNAGAISRLPKRANESAELPEAGSELSSGPPRDQRSNTFYRQSVG